MNDVYQTLRNHRREYHDRTQSRDPTIYLNRGGAIAAKDVPDYALMMGRQLDKVTEEKPSPLT